MLFPQPRVTIPPSTASQRRLCEVAPLIALLLLGTALFWTILPIVGPLDDHHFAERTHVHDHLYLDGTPATHQHVFEAGLRHAHYLADTGGDSAAKRDTVATLTAATAIILLTVLTTPYQPAPDQLHSPSPRNSDGNPIAGFATEATQLDGAYPPPLYRPPIG